MKGAPVYSLTMTSPSWRTEAFHASSGDREPCPVADGRELNVLPCFVPNPLFSPLTLALQKEAGGPTTPYLSTGSGKTKQLWPSKLTRKRAPTIVLLVLSPFFRKEDHETEIQSSGHSFVAALARNNEKASHSCWSPSNNSVCLSSWAASQSRCHPFANCYEPVQSVLCSFAFPLTTRVHPRPF